MSRTPDGSEFAGPARGVFLRTSAGRLEYYRHSVEPGLMWLLAHYAMAAGNDLATANWLDRASSGSNGSQLTYLHAVIGRDLIPSVLIADRYAEAIDTAFRCMAALNLYSARPSNERDIFGEGIDLEKALESFSSVQRSGIESNTVLMAVVPSALRVALKAVHDMDAAMSARRELAAVCRQFSANSTTPSTWNRVADALDKWFCNSESTRSLMSFGNQFPAERELGIRVVAYLGVSFCGTPAKAFATQLGLMQVLYTCCTREGTGHRLILLPFLQAYLTDAIHNRRFHFSNPNMVADALETAADVDVKVRGRVILRAVNLGLTANVQPDTLAWLNRDD